MQFRSLHLTPPEWAGTLLDREFPLHCSFYKMKDREISKLHIHDVLELGICYSGKGFFVIEEKVFSFEAGDVFFINHLETHRACVSDGKTARWAFVMTDPSALLGNAAKDPAILRTEDFCGAGFSNRFPFKRYPVLNRILAEMVEEWKNKPPFHRDKIKSLVMEFLVELRRAVPEPGSGATRRPERSAAQMFRLKPALEFILRNYGDEISTPVLSYLCRLSPGHFRRIFVSAFGKGPKEYLNDYRIAMAGNLLRSTGKKVVEIAMDCGFPTLSCFNRQFRMKTGCSPREFRENGRSP